MRKQFPREFSTLVRGIGVKKAFVSDAVALNPLECDNCGGVGTLTLFLATKGPFQSPEPPNKETVNKYEDPFGWWVGSNYSFPCPVCDGIGRKAKKQ